MRGQRLLSASGDQVTGCKARQYADQVDSDYFKRRATEEMTFSEGLSNELTRSLHRELAARYAQLAAAKREAEDKL